MTPAAVGLTAAGALASGEAVVTVEVEESEYEAMVAAAAERTAAIEAKEAAEAEAEALEADLERVSSELRDAQDKLTIASEECTKLTRQVAQVPQKGSNRVKGLARVVACERVEGI